MLTLGKRDYLSSGKHALPQEGTLHCQVNTLGSAPTWGHPIFSNY